MLVRSAASLRVSPALRPAITRALTCGVRFDGRPPPELDGRAVVLIATGRPVGHHAWGLPAWGGRVGIRAAADLRVRFADAVAAVCGRIQRLVTGSGGPTSRARALVTAFH